MRSSKKNTTANRLKKGGAAALLIAVACLAGGSTVPGERWFEDVTQRAGVARKHTNRSFKNPYAHIMAGYTALGASAAVADYDGDGFDDVFVTDSKEDGKNRLLRAVTELSQAFALAVPHDDALRIRDDVGFFQAVRAVLSKSAPGDRKTDEDLDHAIRQIISKAMVSDEVIDIFAAPA